MRNYEAAHAFTFDWIVRMRPDVWFFGSLPRHCALSRHAIHFPAGVTGCGYTPCINDHIAFAPRHLASHYFDVVEDMGTCEGMRNLSHHWRNYMLWRLLAKRVPLAEPSPIVPYTLLRPCANASTRSFYPECVRWTSRPPEKNAGLHHYTNGSALPGAPAFRAERDRLYEVCRTRGLARFPHYAVVDAVEPSRLRSLCAAKASGRPPRGG